MARTLVSTTIDRIRRQLSSGYRNEINTLSAPLTNSATIVSLTYTLTNNFQPGALLSVGTELMRVMTVDTVNKQVSVIRGFHDSTAAAHANGTEVWVNSRFTGMDIWDALIEEIGSYGPQLYRVVESELVVSDAQQTIELPTSMRYAYGIVDVHRWTDDQTSVTVNKAWPRANVRMVRYDPAVWTDYSTSGVILRFIDSMAAGRVIVKAAVPFALPTDTADDLVTDVGVPESMLDVVSMGTRLRVLHDNQAGSTARTTQDEPRRATENPPGSGSQDTQINVALYRNRKQEEINKLRALYPIRCS
jgi:hypothetical protein